MRNSFKRVSMIALIMAGLLTHTAFAHGIWFAERATQLALIYGVGADDLDTVKRLTKVESTKAYDEDWDEIDVSLRVSGPLVVVDSDEAIHAITAVMQNGLWSNMPDGDWKKGGRDVNKDARLAEKTIKYAVHIPGNLPKNIPLFADQILQIIPVGEIMPTMIGEEIVVQVLYKGKPAEGAQVKADFVTDPDATPILTDKNGFARFKIKNQGLNVVTAIFDGPSDAPKIIDKVEHLSTLSFVLDHAPE